MKEILIKMLESNDYEDFRFYLCGRLKTCHNCESCPLDDIESFEKLIEELKQENK